MDPMTILALASAAGGLFSSLSGGGGPKKMRTKTREQEKAINSLLQQAQQMQGQGGGYSQAMNLLQGYLDPNSDVYKNFEQPYIQQFEQQTVPGLAERFAGAGAGALSSSGFGQALGSAGSDLQTRLAAMKSGMQSQAAQSLISQYNQLINAGTSPDMFAYGQEGGEGFGGGFAQGVGGALPYLLMSMMKGGGAGYKPKFPLTSYYDKQFRMNPAEMGY